MAGASMMMMPIMSGTGSVTVAITQRDRPIVAAACALIGSIAIGVAMMISQRSGTKRQVRESRSATSTTSRRCVTPSATRSAPSAPSRRGPPPTDQLLDIGQ